MELASLLRRVLEGDDLDAAQAETLMDAMMQGALTPVQIAGALMTMRTRGETLQELVGFARAMRAHSVKVPIDNPDLLDTCGTGGDTLKTWNLSTATAFVVAAAGVPVAKHGNRAVSSKCGSADVLEALGVNLNLTPEQIAQGIEQVGVGFMFAPLHHPAMRHVAPVRRELGVRTVFNLLGPLTNPANARKQLLGVFSWEWLTLIAEALAQPTPCPSVASPRSTGGWSPAGDVRRSPARRCTIPCRRRSRTPRRTPPTALRPRR
jgi:anthranilate phosphoribosyltransferase